MNIIKEKVAIRVPGAKEGKREEIRTRWAFNPNYLELSGSLVDNSSN